MQIIQSAEEAVNRRILPPGSVVAMQGSAATPRELCRQLARDRSIRGISLVSCLPMGTSPSSSRRRSAAASPTG